MPRPYFAAEHNMLAFLQKPSESEGFAEIVDFLNASYIRYALTANPTIYVSHIKQFWATAKVKTRNREVRIHSIVDGQKIIVTEASVREALQLSDADGIDNLPDAAIFENLRMMGYVRKNDYLKFNKGAFPPQWKFLIHTILQCLSPKTTGWNQFSSNMASAVICLARNEKKFNFSKLIFNSVVKALDGSAIKVYLYPRFLQLVMDNQFRHRKVHNRVHTVRSHTKKVFSNMRRKGKDFPDNVEPLFQSMLELANQNNGKGSVNQTGTYHRKSNKRKNSHKDKSRTTSIKRLKLRVKHLGARKRPRTHNLKRLNKVGTAKRVEYSTQVAVEKSSTEYGSTKRGKVKGVVPEEGGGVDAYMGGESENGVDDLINDENTGSAVAVEKGFNAVRDTNAVKRGTEAGNHVEGIDHPPSLKESVPASASSHKVNVAVTETPHLVESTSDPAEAHPSVGEAAGSDVVIAKLKELTELVTTCSNKLTELENDHKSSKEVYGSMYSELSTKVKEMIEKEKRMSTNRRDDIIDSSSCPGPDTVSKGDNPLNEVRTTMSQSDERLLGSGKKDAGGDVYTVLDDPPFVPSTTCSPVLASANLVRTNQRDDVIDSSTNPCHDNGSKGDNASKQVRTTRSQTDERLLGFGKKDSGGDVCTVIDDRPFVPITTCGPVLSSGGLVRTKRRDNIIDSSSITGHDNGLKGDSASNQVRTTGSQTDERLLAFGKKDAGGDVCNVLADRPVVPTSKCSPVLASAELVRTKRIPANGNSTGKVIHFKEAQGAQKKRNVCRVRSSDDAEYDPTEEDIEWYIKNHPEVYQKAIEVIADMSLTKEQRTAQIKDFIKMRYYQTVSQMKDSLQSGQKNKRQATMAQVVARMKRYCCHVGNWKMRDFTGMSHDAVCRIFYREKKRDKNFIPMDVDNIIRKYNGYTGFKRANDCIHIGEEGESRGTKRASSTVTSVGANIREAFSHYPEHEMNDMSAQVLHVDPIQTRHPIMHWEVYSYGIGKGWKITRVGGNAALYKSLEELVACVDRSDLDRIWELAQEKESISKIEEDKEKELWVELKRMYEPDPSDRCWDFPCYILGTKWKFYTSCGVHQLSTGQGDDLFMLPEVEYPLPLNVLAVMISVKLSTEENTEVATSLIERIHSQLERERQKSEVNV